MPSTRLGQRNCSGREYRLVNPSPIIDPKLGIAFDPMPEERQTGLNADGGADHECRGDDDRASDDREDVSAEDAGVGKARDAGCVDEELALRRDDHVPDDAEDRGRQEHPEDEHGEAVVAAGDRHQHDQQQDSGEGHDEVEQPLRAGRDGPAEESADEARGHSDQEGDGYADEAGDDARLDGCEKPCEDVSA